MVIMASDLRHREKKMIRKFLRNFKSNLISTFGVNNSVTYVGSMGSLPSRDNRTAKVELHKLFGYAIYKYEFNSSANLGRSGSARGFLPGITWEKVDRQAKDFCGIK